LRSEPISPLDSLACWSLLKTPSFDSFPRLGSNSGSECLDARLPGRQRFLKPISLVVGPLGCELQVVDLIEETNQFAEILVAKQFLESAVGR
jgi:hypothetical protein